MIRRGNAGMKCHVILSDYGLWHRHLKVYALNGRPILATSAGLRLQVLEALTLSGHRVRKDAPLRGD